MKLREPGAIVLTWIFALAGIGDLVVGHVMVIQRLTRAPNGKAPREQADALARSAGSASARPPLT